VTGPTYPPARHVLRDLDFEVERLAEDHHRARFRPCGGGATELGGVLTVVDLLAGAVCLGAVAPDWMATSALTFHLTEPLPPGVIVLSARIARAGRTTVAVEVDARPAPAGPSLGEGMVTFSRLVRREQNRSLPLGGTEPASTFSFPSDGGAAIGAGGTLVRAIGCTVIEAAGGVTETPVDDYVRNSFGAMNGGVVATLIENAALAHARRGGSRPQVTDMVVHYLSQGRHGPVRTEVSALRAGASLRVEVVDSGRPDGDRLMAIAHVGIGAAASGEC
jgi:acyl-coenzyme A thioesterase PaaI-like protein